VIIVYVCVCACVRARTHAHAPIHMFQTFPLLNHLIDSIALAVNVSDWRTPQHHIFQCPVVREEPHWMCGLVREDSHCVTYRS